MSIARQTEILELGFNSNANAIVTLGEFGNETIKGNVFFNNIFTTIATSNETNVGITTPSDKDIRFLLSSVSADINFVKTILYESPTFTGSTTISSVNANRQSSTTSGVVIHSAFSVEPVVTSATVLDIFATLGGTSVAGNSTGNEQDAEHYFLLKRNTKYLLKISNEDSATANVLIKNEWIETDLTD